MGRKADAKRRKTERLKNKKLITRYPLCDTGAFRIKIPLHYIAEHLDDRGYEFDERDHIIRCVLKYFLLEFVPAFPEIKEITASYEKPYEEIVSQVTEADYPDHELFDHYNNLYEAMDDWVVVKTDEGNENITQIIMKKKQGENRIETVDWRCDTT